VLHATAHPHIRPGAWGRSSPRVRPADVILVRCFCIRLHQPLLRNLYSSPHVPSPYFPCAPRLSSTAFHSSLPLPLGQPRSRVSLSCHPPRMSPCLLHPNANDVLRCLLRRCPPAFGSVLRHFAREQDGCAPCTRAPVFALHALCSHAPCVVPQGGPEHSTASTTLCPLHGPPLTKP
jgi:hypothetical protein